MPWRRAHSTSFTLVFYHANTCSSTGGHELGSSWYPVVEGLGRRIPARQRGRRAGRQRLMPARAAGADQPLMVQVRAAVSAVIEVVLEREVLRQLAFGQVGRVIAAEHEALVVAPGHELVHRVRPVGRAFEHAVV